MFFLPDRYSVFDFVDDVSTRGERFRAVACADAHPHSHLADCEVSDAVYTGGMFDSETGDRFGDDALAFLDGQRLECFVFEVADC